MKSQRQIQAENRLRKAIKKVEGIMPDGIGIAMFVFEHGTEKGNIGYIANAERQSMRRALTEFLGKWDADAAGAPFYPLTLDAFEGWIRQQAKDTPESAGSLGPALAALEVYRDLSNHGATNTAEVSQQ